MPEDPRVLIVEDHDALRAILFTILRHQRLAVDTASSAVEAMEMIMVCDYALILIDLDLAGGEAQAFLKSFREVRPDATTFVIAARDPKKEVDVDANIVSVILNKPLEIDTVAEVVRECAAVVEPPPNPIPCPPSESEREMMDRGEYMPN